MLGIHVLSELIFFINKTYKLYYLLLTPLLDIRCSNFVLSYIYYFLQFEQVYKKVYQHLELQVSFIRLSWYIFSYYTYLIL